MWSLVWRYITSTAVKSQKTISIPCAHFAFCLQFLKWVLRHYCYRTIFWLSLTHLKSLVQLKFFLFKIHWSQCFCRAKEKFLEQWKFTWDQELENEIQFILSEVNTKKKYEWWQSPSFLSHTVSVNNCLWTHHIYGFSLVLVKTFLVYIKHRVVNNQGNKCSFVCSLDWFYWGIILMSIAQTSFEFLRNVWWSWTYNLPV